MKEEFPPQQAGDIISAELFNQHSEVLKRFALTRPGPNMMGYHRGSTAAVGVKPAYISGRFIVTEEVDRLARIYNIQRRCYDASAEVDVPAASTPPVWITNDLDTYLLDALDIGEGFGPRLWPGDVVPAYYDQQRGVFVPRSVPMRRLAVVTQLGGIAANSSGEITIYINYQSTAWTEQADFKWLYTSQGLDVNQRVIVQWYPDIVDEDELKGRWVIEVPWC